MVVFREKADCNNVYFNIADGDLDFSFLKGGKCPVDLNRTANPDFKREASSLKSKWIGAGTRAAEAVAVAAISPAALRLRQRASKLQQKQRRLEQKAFSLGPQIAGDASSTEDEGEHIGRASFLKQALINKSRIRNERKQELYTVQKKRKRKKKCRRGPDQNDKSRLEAEDGSERFSDVQCDRAACINMPAITHQSDLKTERSRTQLNRIPCNDDQNATEMGLGCANLSNGKHSIAVNSTCTNSTVKGDKSFQKSCVNKNEAPCQHDSIDCIGGDVGCGWLGDGSTGGSMASNEAKDNNKCCRKEISGKGRIGWIEGSQRPNGWQKSTGLTKGGRGIKVIRFVGQNDGLPGKRKTKTRSRQKNIRKDRRPDHLKPKHLQMHPTVLNSFINIPECGN